MTILSLVLPPVLGYFVVALLAVIPQTHALRVALWPVVAFFALRAAVSDMSSGDPDTKYYNAFLVLSMVLVIARTLDWSLEKEPLSHPEKGSSMMNALRLASTFRGQGWAWSHGMHFPRETRPTHRRGFTFHVILSAVFHSILTGVVYGAVRSFTGLGSPSGGSIFDETLPFHVRYLRAGVISALTLFASYASFQSCYDICTIVGVLLLGQDPAQWPPAFDAPWLATSLGDFWGRRWHQFLRRTFLVLGGRPLARVLGRAGLVVGSFLASGVLHHVAMAPLNGRSEPWRMLVGFGMMALGVIAERALWRPLTGRRVGGVVGWMWTWAWLLVWGSVIIDAFARGGVFGHMGVLDRAVVPGRAVVHRLVVNVDAWLRTV